jgi:hypothetical protein
MPATPFQPRPSVSTQTHFCEAPSPSMNELALGSQRQFKSPGEWLGEEGSKFRKQWSLPSPSEQFNVEWKAFLSGQHRTDAGGHRKRA